MQHCSIASLRKFVPLSRHLRYTGISISGTCWVQSSGLYDIKYDCKTIFCCRGPTRCQLHHFWALKVSPHDEVMLTLREKDNDPTACTDSQSTDHASNCEIVPTPGLWSWCQATRLIATPMITDEPLHETIFRNQLQNELSDGQSGTSLLCEDKIFSRVHHSMIADVSLPYIDCMVKMI